MQKRNLAIMIATVFIPCIMLSCQPRRSPQPVGGTAAELTVTVNNMTTEDAAKSELIYELSSCTDTVTGSATEATDAKKVSFKGKGFKRELDCEVRIKNPNANLSEIKFLSEETSGVLYLAKKVEIKEDANGKFIANANMQKNYVTLIPDPTHAFTLTVSVAFEAEENDTPITAAMTCEEKIPNVGSYVKEDAKNGKFEFLVGISPDDKNKAYTCTSMMVHVGGVSWKYRGDFSGNGGNFEANPGDKIMIPKGGRVTLKLLPQPGTDPVSVTTKGVECPAGTHYDYDARDCIKN